MATGVVLNLPEHGHLNATIPLVTELVARGDRLIYYGTEPHRRAIEVTGAQYARYAGDPTLFDPPAPAGGLYSVMAFLMTITEQILPYVLRRLELERPDYLLIDSMCLWGRLAQQITGIPAVMLGSVMVPDDRRVSMEDMIVQAYGRAPREVLLAGIEALNGYLQISQRVDLRYNTRSPNIVELFANRQPLNVIFTSRYFHVDGDQYDDSYLFAGPSLAPRQDESIANLNLLTTGAGSSAAAFGNGSDSRALPLIYLSLGTIFQDRAEQYRACFEALADGPWQVLASVGRHVNRAELGTIPANISVRDYVWHLDVLSRASLCLTHGGMNTVSEMLWFGLPLLVYPQPQHTDQQLVAARVDELGAGVRLTPADLQPDRLRALVTRVLTEPAFKREADRIAASFRTSGGVPRAADAINAYVAEARAKAGAVAQHEMAPVAVRTAGEGRA